MDIEENRLMMEEMDRSEFLRLKQLKRKPRPFSLINGHIKYTKQGVVQVDRPGSASNQTIHEEVELTRESPLPITHQEEVVEYTMASSVRKTSDRYLLRTVQ